MSDIKQILNNIGYDSLREDGKFWRTKPLYRESKNPTSLRIAKDTGFFQDFSANISGNLEHLISITLGIPSKEAKEYTLNVDKVKVEYKEKIQFDSEVKEWEDLTLVSNYNFYQNRGISKETQELFESKLCLSGKFNRRQVFPIRVKGKLLGITGRAVIDNPLKWKKLGMTSKWVYPLHLTEEYIKKTRKLVLIESIGDGMALWEAYVNNFLILFGVKLSPRVKAEIIRLNPKEIIIATNNDTDGSGAGNKAAMQIKKELSVFFTEDDIKISLPKKNDFGSQDLGENLEWAQKNL